MSDLLLQIDLCTVLGVTAAFPVGNNTSLSAMVIPVSTYTTASWAVDLQWSMRLGEYENWLNFETPVQLTHSATAKADIDVANRGFLRFRTTTAEPGADPAAIIVGSLLRFV